MTIRDDPIGRDAITVLADRKNVLAAARSRCSLSITSTNAPLRSNRALAIPPLAAHPNLYLVERPNFELTLPFRLQ